MTIPIGIVMDPIGSITPYKDTSLAMLLAAQARGWQLFYMEIGDLMVIDGHPYGSMRPIKVMDDTEHWYELGEPKPKPLSSLHAILMRKDPPFDSEFLYATHILDMAEQEGSLIVNAPNALRSFNEKLFATLFPKCCPPLVVSQQAAIIKAFHQKYQDIVIKPLNGMGGQGIFRCGPEEKNLSVIIEMLTQQGQQAIMAQQFIPDISNGDKRILIVDGEAVPFCLARIPAKGETRGNLAAGGRGQAQPLTERDAQIASEIAPKLVKEGILFAGIDVIGDYLTEINITSPTCAREIDAAYNTDIGGRLMDAIERRLKLQP